jgi:small subunit ribosomal protein S17
MDHAENTNKKKKILLGSVISDKMDKTVVITVERTFKHPLLHKVLRRTKKYKVHDEHNVAKVGDLVEAYEGRPVSKTKYMYLARVISARD